MPLIGTIALHYEQGMTHSIWTFQDHAHIHGTGPYRRCDPGGMHMLENGDHLTIFDMSDRSKIVWQGLIDISAKPHVMQSSFGRIICQPPVNVKLDDWVEWFIAELPAEYVKKT